jgi:hypothetical protein
MRTIDQLFDDAEDVESKEDLARFIDNLGASLSQQREAWENVTIERFFDAWAHSLPNIERFYNNCGREAPSQPNWNMIAQMLLTAAIYE